MAMGKNNLSFPKWESLLLFGKTSSRIFNLITFIEERRHYVVDVIRGITDSYF